VNIAINARLLHSDHIEGMGRFIYETTVALASMNPDDNFILFYDRQIKSKLAFPANVNKIIVPLPTRHPILWHTWFEVLIPYYLKKYKINVFLSGDGYLSLRTSVPTILVTHDLAYLYYPEHIQWLALQDYKYFTPKYHRKAAHIITVSDYVRQDIIHNMNVPADKVSVAYNALKSLNIQISEDFNLPHIKKGNYFIYVGSLHPRKNIINLIDGFLKFNHSNDNKYQLVLAGRLAWKADMIKDKINSSPNVNHVGLVSESEKYMLLHHSIALIYVSFFEGFGIPLLEAMYAQTAIITSNCTSMPEVGGDAAIYVDPNDINTIASAMQKLIIDKELRLNLIAKGNQRLKDFQWSESAKIIYSVIKTAFDNNK